MPKSFQSKPIMTVAEIEGFLDAEFPQLHHGGRTFSVEDVGSLTCRMRMTAHEKHLRPGGTVSGPAMFALADVGLYVVILAHIGPIALAVTTNLNINFLRKPPARDLIAHCRLLKLGKRLAVGEVTIYAENSDEPVAHAVGTYSIPAPPKAVI